MTPELQTLHDLWLVRWGHTYVRIPIGFEADEDALTWHQIAKKLGNANLMGSVTTDNNALIFKLRETKE